MNISMLMNAKAKKNNGNLLRLKKRSFMEVAETNHRLLLLETAIKRLREDETAMNYNVTLKTLPERYVASVRQVIPAYDQESVLWNIMMNETSPLGVQTADNCFNPAQTSNPEELVTEVCYPVKKK